MFDLQTCYDESSQELVFHAKVPDNTYFSIGFGENMISTDMIAWSVKDGVGSIRDLWSFGFTKPREDQVSNIYNEVDPVTEDDGRMTFVTRRPLDTGDSSEDYLAQLGVKMPMIYAYRTSDSNFIYHEKRG